MSEESQEVKIARLEERLVASDKALVLAERLSAADKKAWIAIVLAILTFLSRLIK